MLLTLLLTGCAETPSPAGPTLPLTPCHVEGLNTESLCGTYTVFENRQDGATIDLRVLVLPAVSPDPAPDPLFFLAGGPGQAASEIAAAVLPAFKDIQKQRDLVFIDQRGTGQSAPLDCPEDDRSLAERLAADPVEEMERCLAGLSGDLTQYLTPNAIDDFDEVRRALGYAQVNLYGASYGTRAGLVYLRRHPESVRSAILDGLAPTTMIVGLDFARDGQASLDALLDDCAAAEECAAAFPSLREDLAALLAAPPHEVRVDHPRTKAPLTLTVDRDLIASGLMGQLYAPPFSSLLPLAIADAAAGDFSPFIAQTVGMSEGMTGSISDGMKMTVLCTEDVPRLPEDTTAYTEGTFLGDLSLRELRDICAQWPKGELPAGYNEPVVSDAPVLLLSGALDPVTPPRWGEAVAEHLPASRHLVAPGAGHNAAPLGCMPRLMEAFLEAGSADELDVSCVERIHRPPFFIDFAGPTQ